MSSLLSVKKRSGEGSGDSNDEKFALSQLSRASPSGDPSVMPGFSSDKEDDETRNLVEPAMTNPTAAFPRPAFKLSNGIPTRWQLALLSMFGFMFLYALRFNISQALVAMTGNVTYCNGTPANPQFNWSSEAQGVIQSSFFYGYTAMALPGGWLCGVFGSKRVIAVSMTINALLCLLTPVMATAGVPYLIMVRVMQGLVQAPFYPAMHRMWGRWAPQADVGALSSLSYSGPYIGNILSYLLGGFLSESGFGASSGQTYCGANWPSIFYVFGAGALAWTVIWMFLAFETPDVHPRISHAERTYIIKNLAHDNADPEDRIEDKPYSFLDLFPIVACLPRRYVQNCRIPWRAIVTSKPVWALCFSLFTFDYGMYTLMTNVPKYLNEVENFDVASSGIFSALPFLCMWIFTLLAGAVNGLSIVQNNLSFNVQRKSLTLIGTIFPAGFLILAGYSTSRTSAVAYITASAGISGVQMIGAGINQIDLAPRYADVLMGFSNLFASMGGILAPYFAAVLTPNHTAAEWRLVFFITSGMFVAGAVGFAIFGSAEHQWWALGDTQKRPGGASGAHSRLSSKNHRNSESPLLDPADSGAETVQYSV
ncbi:sialin-like [Sycon ciliatum]|uniref:sialin-like n=1 Tax=Sycon ciliatum TaxID=27933 RepID=UPI0020AED776|eukprot:scpid40089/ scgid6890/ Sialin; Membrane glycoprotein HP59; Sodium/sialic acid cotransporter; Solute carrier family 17 member 5